MAPAVSSLMYRAPSGPGTASAGRPQRLPSDLAAIQGVGQPSITEMVAILERAGYVERHRDPLDGRASLAALTAVGRAAFVTAGA
jgi:DNA-binding MarR family transcriptional regulator